MLLKGHHEAALPRLYALAHGLASEEEADLLEVEHPSVPGCHPRDQEVDVPELLHLRSMVGVENVLQRKPMQPQDFPDGLEQVRVTQSHDVEPDHRM